ncbi:hypothetical protein OJAV_G00010860 [Oryzias javanicus]|uniref:Uncharacterized protein n=1 Tax=Oryzias javanicus TaxID=123683 RepID=A0A437DNH2_ORYJA|nr:hypothetical protein OJAV_G00010860 [Oryzias javanicus]
MNKYNFCIRVWITKENMAEAKVGVEVPPVEFRTDPGTSCNPPQDYGSREEKADPTGSHRELDESLLLLADVALAPPCGRDASCTCLEVRQAELGLQCTQQQLQAFLRKVEHLRDCLVSRKNQPDNQTLTAAVLTLLHTCQPFFRRLESTARSTASKPSHLSVDVCAKLLDFSQELSDRLEQLLLTYASFKVLSLDEADPNSVSSFCIGQFRVRRLQLTVFRFCKPTPYLAQVDTGLYKRMRWNVERLTDRDGDGGEQPEDADRHTDYFFLCYKDVPNKSDQGAARVWSIGQWLQLDPDATDDVYDWIWCEVPRGDYKELLCFGCSEPSSRSATDVVQQLLLQRHAE